MMRYPLLAALHPVLVSYWSPNQIRCNILSWTALPRPLLCSFLIKSLFKSDAICCPRCFASSCVRFSFFNIPSFLFEFLLKYDAISSLGCPPGCLASSCVRSLLTPYANMMQYALLAALPTPVYVFYSSATQIWCNILSWLPCLLSCLFLIESLLKYDAISCPRCFASSCVRFSLNSYPNMLQYLLLAALLAALPPHVFVPY